ncbi:MAG: hypothetical protein N4A48_09775 [Tepidibacter sp.]|uniref:hypothetical protein n=1 Tax=Tepidibacter sp. TaxID=2529387 RepID=UPI0025FCC104|nr:hypothetical protein [Tepidibacter sp.]MCT4509029.1 hypothetical protein [Tepidibacter sp.]
MTGFDNIRIKSPYNIKIVEDIKLEHKLNEHAKLYLKGIIDENINFDTSINATLNDEIHIYEVNNKTIFKGLASSVKTINKNGVYYIELQAISGSFLLDTKKKSKSFQETNIKYSQLISETIKDYQNNSYTNNINKETKIEKPIIQYKETDWEFIKRLASHFNSVIVCDIMDKNPKFHFGLPKGKSHTIPDNISYNASKDLFAFQKAGGYEAGFHDTDFFYYEIETKNQYQIGDEIWFRKKRLYVSEINAYIDKGLLKYRYKLSRQKGIYQNNTYNTNLKGASLEGKVIDTKAELVKLHLNIDKNQPKDKAHWFSFTPPTGNVMYCMPKIGTNASLYFPNNIENNAKVVGCIRKNGSSCQKTKNPNTRYFGTEHGSELELSPGNINIVAGCKEPLKISFDDSTGITIKSHKKLRLNAGEEISLYTPKKIIIKAQSQLFTKRTKALNGFSIENEYHFLGTNVNADGSDRTQYPPFDDEPKQGQPPKKSPFNWGKLAKNVLAGLAVVAVVTIAAVAVAATLGAAAPLVGAIALSAGIGGTAAVASKAISDIKRGEVSDTSDYMATAGRETFIGALSGALFGPFGAASTVSAKMILGGITNGFESCVRQTLEDGKIDPWTLGFDVGIGILTGGAFHYGGKGLKKLASEGSPAVSPWLKKGASKIFNSIDNNINKFTKAGNKFGKRYLNKAQRIAKEFGEGYAQKAKNLVNRVDNLVPQKVVTPDGQVYYIKKSDIEPTSGGSGSSNKNTNNNKNNKQNKEYTSDPKIKLQLHQASEEIKDSLEKYRKALIKGEYGEAKGISTAACVMDITDTSRRGFAGNKMWKNNPTIIDPRGIDPTTICKTSEDYVKYYRELLSDKYIDDLPESFFIGKDKKLMKQEMEELRKMIEKTKDLAIKEGKYNKYGEPSFEFKWNVENCAEIWAMRDAILKGAEIDNLIIRSVHTSDGSVKEFCDNCLETFYGFYNID